MMSKNNFSLVLVTALVSSLFQMTMRAKAADFNLHSVHQSILNDYDNVSHINKEALSAALESGKKHQYLLFDVREESEYLVSHIKGAVQLGPGSWRSSFLKKHGDKLKGKTIIFYCSVGVRSSKMASYLMQDLKSAGADKVYNLQEGIFGWANDNKEMNNQNGITGKVHPYNEKWGQLIKDKERRLYELEKN